MKSKSLKDDEDKGRAFDFIHLYKKAEETTVKLKAHEELNDVPKMTKKSNKHRLKSPNKHNLKHNIANYNGIENVSQPREKATSELANNTSKKDKAATKPIIRNSGNSPDQSTSKPKKRNKSVSFILDENEEVEVKKTKSEAFNKNSKDKYVEINTGEKIMKKKLKKKHNISNNAEKGNSDTTEELPDVGKNKNILKDSMQIPERPENNETIKKKKNKELKKIHKQQKLKEQDTEQDATTLPENVVDQNNVKEKKTKQKKKKHLSKMTGDIDTNEDEPAIKSRKKDVKPEAVAEDLENLNIGDNTHILTNLLDEMVVVDKNKQKNKKPKQNKGNQPVPISTDTNIEGTKLKEKWRKKRWNKDRKPVALNKELSSSVAVDNLPNRIILNYKKLLAEHFSKCGVIKKIGVAEIYLTDDPKPVFSTTIVFDNQEAALKALEEDNTSYEGNFIRIKQILPPNKTTLVVRSYGELTEHALSSALNGAGRIRNIRIMSKSRKTMGTAFIEFDGPAALDRAVQIAEDIKIGGKKVYLSKFEFRRSSKPYKAENSAVKENDDSSDSSDDD